VPHGVVVVMVVLLASAGGGAHAQGTGVTGVRTAAVASGDPVIAAAGDIACDPTHQFFNGGAGSSTYCHEIYTSDLLVNGGLSAVLAVGDDQYWCDGAGAFSQSYGPTWGRVKAITYPAAGNHEYYTSGGTDCDTTGKGAGYFGYFGSAAGDPTKGYYSFDVGSWHLIALNTNCNKVGGCGVGSAQEQWLKADLAAHPTACTLAYFHYPLFSSKTPLTAASTFWSDLYAAGADVVISAHVHNYERFAPQDPNGTYDPAKGIREFVVGTGGMSLEGFPTTVSPNSEVRARNFGVLELTLHSTSYDWQFVPDGRNGNTFSDSGSGTCHFADASPPVVSVSAPADGARVGGVVGLAAAASDNVAVDHVDFLVNGVVVGSDAGAPYAVSWNSALVADGVVSVAARAVDSSGNVATSVGRSVTVDNTAPETTIDSGPVGTVASGSATFAFSSSEGGSLFACSLDGGAFLACSSPKGYAGLADGPHTFAVRATDAVGNTDASPATRGWTVATGTLFSNGFENGDFVGWGSVITGADGTAIVETNVVASGGYAAQFSATSTSGSRAYARATLASPQTDLTVTASVDVLAEGLSGANVPLLRLFDPSGVRLLSLYRQNESTNSIWVTDSSTRYATTGKLPLGTWAQVEVHTITAGPGASTLDVRLNGTSIFQSSSSSLGSTGVLTLQVGNDTAAQPFTLVADDVSAHA
jgi:hypothetical protein